MVGLRPMRSETAGVRNPHSTHPTPRQVMTPLIVLGEKSLTVSRYDGVKVTMTMNQVR
jgi:hypothetical protein